mmetsp:Transcript_11630/g.36826  ORF Transcript_11630/g.36826 Transcript_11630/m.36826 type:complete len:442 (-) Transcript_11630:197-1522(-)
MVELRGDEAFRAAHPVEDRDPFLVEIQGEAEIRELGNAEVPHFLDEDVVRLDVAVHDAARVEVLHGAHQRLEHHRSLGRGEDARVQHEVVLQGPPRHTLHEEHALARALVDEHVLVIHDARVAQGHRQARLGDHLPQLLLRAPLEVDQLGSKEGPSGVLLGGEHGGEAAIPQLLRQGEVGSQALLPLAIRARPRARGRGSKGRRGGGVGGGGGGGGGRGMRKLACKHVDGGTPSHVRRPFPPLALARARGRGGGHRLPDRLCPLPPRIPLFPEVGGQWRTHPHPHWQLRGPGPLQLIRDSKPRRKGLALLEPLLKAPAVHMIEIVAPRPLVPLEAAICRISSSVHILQDFPHGALHRLPVVFGAVRQPEPCSLGKPPGTAISLPPPPRLLVVHFQSAKCRQGEFFRFARRWLGRCRGGCGAGPRAPPALAIPAVPDVEDAL